MKNILYISYATKKYLNVIDKYLLPSLERFNLDKLIYKFDVDFGSWNENAQIKYLIILVSFLQNYEYLVWLDADSQILQYPELFYKIPEEYDLGICYLNWKEFWNSKLDYNEVLGGTIYIKKSEKTIKLIKDVINKIAIERIWGQKALENLLKNNKNIKIYSLPLSYCQIIKKDGIIPKNTVIAQWQKSREFRK